MASIVRVVGFEDPYSWKTLDDDDDDNGGG